MIHMFRLLPVQNRSCRQAIASWGIRVVVTDTQCYVLDILSDEFAAVTTTHLVLKKELTKASEPDDVASLVVFFKLDGGDVDHAAVGFSCIARCLHRARE